MPQVAGSRRERSSCRPGSCSWVSRLSALVPFIYLTHFVVLSAGCWQQMRAQRLRADTLQQAGSWQRRCIAFLLWDNIDLVHYSTRMLYCRLLEGDEGAAGRDPPAGPQLPAPLHLVAFSLRNGADSASAATALPTQFEARTVPIDEIGTRFCVKRSTDVAVKIWIRNGMGSRLSKCTSRLVHVSHRRGWCAFLQTTHCCSRDNWSCTLRPNKRCRLQLEAPTVPDEIGAHLFLAETSNCDTITGPV